MVETEYVLHLSNVEKRYGKNKILKGVNLSLQRGRIYGLIGQNGAGKTTIMRVIAGLVLPDSGSIQLFGEYEKIDFVRKNVGCIIESPTLYPNLTAMENLNIIRRLKNIEEDESLSDILSMLQINDTSKKVKNYSVGMKQKVGIAMALIGDPQLLILDEPLNGLDPIAIVRLRKYLQKLIVYSLGLGIPFILSALLIHLLAGVFQFIKAHYSIIKGISGALLIVIGICMATGYLNVFLSLLTF